MMMRRETIVYTREQHRSIGCALGVWINRENPAHSSAELCRFKSLSFRRSSNSTRFPQT